MEGQPDIAKLQRQNEKLSRQVVMYSELLNHIIEHAKQSETFSLLDVLTMIASVMRH